MSKAYRAITIALLSGALTQQMAWAAQPNYNQGVKDYTAGKYVQALAQFDACKAAYPNNALVHYYRALCLQSVGQLSQAKGEFEWVCEHGDGRLKSMASSGLSQLSRAHTSSSSAASSVSTQASAPVSAGAGHNKGKVKKVLDFYADWCGPCKEFGPVFEEVKSHMRDITFERHDVDDESSASLKAQYPFASIPHIVMLDGAGNVLYSGNPGRDVESFQQQILQFR